jgi:hypothetical protein
MDVKHFQHLHDDGAHNFDHQYWTPKMANNKNLLHFHVQPKWKATTHYDVRK